MAYLLSLSRPLLAICVNISAMLLGDLSHAPIHDNAPCPIDQTRTPVLALRVAIDTTIASEPWYVVFSIRLRIISMRHCNPLFQKPLQINPVSVFVVSAHIELLTYHHLQLFL